MASAWTGAVTETGQLVFRPVGKHFRETIPEARNWLTDAKYEDAHAKIGSVHSTMILNAMEKNYTGSTIHQAHKHGAVQNTPVTIGQNRTNKAKAR